jgi:hypothetical protein
MSRILSRAMTVGVLCAVASIAGAHSDDASNTAPLQMDCDHLPAKAVTALPAPFDAWAQLECRPSGQFLVQGEDWSWRYPASFTDQVLIPAWMPDPDSLATGARYFNVVTVSMAEGDKAMALHDQFVKEVVPYRIRAGGSDAAGPQFVYTLTGVNDLGQEVKVHWVYRSDKDVWGIVCAPGCRPEYAFMAAKRGA